MKWSESLPNGGKVMRSHKIHISILGLVLQIIFFSLLTRRLGYWHAVAQYFIVVAVLFLLYPVFIDKHPTLKRFTTLYFIGIIVAGLLSGLFAGFESVALGWLLLSGILTGILVATILYHIVHLIVPDGLREYGFSIFFEISLTFFACSSYLMLLFIPFMLVNAFVLVVVIFAVSLLAGFALTAPLSQSTDMVADAMKEWQSIDALSAPRITIVNRLFSLFNTVLTRIKSSLGTLRDMGREIKASSEDLSSVAEQMSASLQEVSSTIQQISTGAQEQSTAITSIAKSIEELNTLTSSISSQVKMASVSSRRTTDSAQQGMELSKKEAEISKQIFRQTQFIEDKMNELRNQATEIKKILDIIAGITEQTDLLALNAAIEAARVGEQGRGFAVVADEIRNLANETQRSSAVVENSISQINSTVQELNMLLKSEREKVTESNELAAQTEEQFTSIVKAVDLVTDMISRINQAAVNQSENTKELVTQVEQIAHVAADTASATAQVSASVQEQTASMQELTSTAQVLSSFAIKLDELLSTIKK